MGEAEGAELLSGLERVAGLLGGLLGIVGLAIGVATAGLQNVSIVLAAVALVAALGLLAGVVLHQWLRLRLGVGITWVATIVLLVGAVLSSDTFGPFLVPAVALGMYAGTAGSGWPAGRSQAEERAGR